MSDDAPHSYLSGKKKDFEISSRQSKVIIFLFQTLVDHYKLDEETTQRMDHGEGCGEDQPVQNWPPRNAKSFK